MEPNDTDPGSGQSGVEGPADLRPGCSPNEMTESPPSSSQHDQRLYSVGYGARSTDQFVALLQQFGIELLIDVRSAPYSRFKPEFSREPLAALLTRHRIEYRFLGDTLGGQPKDPSCYTDGKVDYDKMRKQALFLSGMEQLREVSDGPKRAVIMCSEGHPEDCHRSKLIGEAAVAFNITLAHIDQNGQLLAQGEVIDRLTGGQLDLFGPMSFRSRKPHRLGRDEPNAG